MKDPVIADTRAGQEPERKSAGTHLVPNLYTVAAIAILGAVFLVALAPKLDTDLWWHLKVGQFIASHHAVPTRDFLSFTFAGKSWTDHEWLSELLLYGLYGLAGLWGTIVGFAVIVWATYFLVYRQMLARGAHPILALFVLTAAFIASSSTWAARPQMITLLFLAIYSFALYRYLTTRDRRLLLTFPLLMILWANLHGGWVLGLVLLGVSLVGEWLNRVTAQPNALEGYQLRDLALAGVAALIATALNPNGIHEVLYPLVWVFPSAYANVLTEWVSPDFHMLQMMFFEGLLLLLIAGVMIARARLNWTYLLTIAVFTYLALDEGRNVAVWTVVVTPLVAEYLQACGPRLRQEFPQLSYRRRPVEGRLGPILNVTLLVLVLITYLAEGVHYVNASALRASERANYPAQAVSYLQHHRLSSRVFTAYAWGGYLLWRGYPQYRDFIDGRANTLFDSRILGDYITASDASPGWDGVLKQYRVGTVMVGRDSPLAQVLAQEPDWVRRYGDDLAVIYERHGT